MASLTRKHFTTLAQALRDNKPCPLSFDPDRMASFDAAAANWDDTVQSVADVLGSFNASFDRDRFIAACNAD